MACRFGHMILAFAGRRAQALDGDPRPLRRRIDHLLDDMRPRVVVGGAADGADVMVAEAALRMRDVPVVHVVLPTRPETFRQDSVQPLWRDRFDGVLAEVVSRGGTVTGLGLSPGQDAYGSANQAILDMAVGFQERDERCVVLVVASPGEGRMVEDMVARARSHGLPVVRIDPAAGSVDQPADPGADPVGPWDGSQTFGEAIGVRSDGHEPQ